MTADQTPLMLSDPPPLLGDREITPLSVLQTARRDWQKRKKAWAQAGLTGDAGRDHMAIWPTTNEHGQIRWQRAVSVFDPHLTDVHYHWYCPPGGSILDPFAGGATRGLVAAHRGYHYTGMDLSEQQVEANRDQYQVWQERRLITGSATWVTGTAQHVLPTLRGGFDYVFTCPPYHNLERYTNDPQDLSTMGWDTFRETLADIVSETVRLLAPNRFATWVVGDLRGPRGHLRRLPARVDQAHEDVDAPLINDTVIASPLGGKYGVIWRLWEPTRSATRVHSHAHTYVVGDRRSAATEARMGDSL